MKDHLGVIRKNLFCVNLGFSRALGLASGDCLVQDCLGVRSQKAGVATFMEKGLRRLDERTRKWLFLVE